MDKKSDVRNIYSDSFSDTSRYVEMYFSRVYRDEDAMVRYVDGEAACSLLLQRYSMNFGQADVPVGYIAGAATLRRFRRRGLMSELVVEALLAARERGDYMVTLIPADDSLYFFYDKFKFTTVFYIAEKRYTSFHTFRYSKSYTPADVASPEAYAVFDRMMHDRKCCIQHTFPQYLNILADNELDGGKSVALADSETGEISALAFAAMRADRLVVKDLLAVDDDAASAALAELSAAYPHVPVTWISTPEENSMMPIESRGMARIVNVKKTLDAYANDNRNLQFTVKVSDPQIPDNSHIYFIDNGICTINDGFRGLLNLDVTVDVLAAILFSSSKVGKIFNLPTRRPFISLMLD